MIRRNDAFRNVFPTIFLEKQGGFEAAETVAGKEAAEHLKNRPYERAHAAIAHTNAVEQNISKFLKEQGIDGKEPHAILEKAKGSLPVTEKVGRHQDTASDALQRKISPDTIDDLKAGYHCDLQFFQTGKASNTQIEGSRQTDAAVGMLVPIADLDSRTNERDVNSVVDPGNLIVRVTPDVGIPYDVDLGSVRQWNWENGTATRSILAKVGQELAKRDSIADLSVPSTPKNQSRDIPPRSEMDAKKADGTKPEVDGIAAGENSSARVDLAKVKQSVRDSNEKSPTSSRA